MFFGYGMGERAGILDAVRTNRVRLLPGRDAERTLRLLGDRVSALWNAANYACRQAFLSGGKVPGYAALCADLKTHETYRALPSDIAQEVLKKLSEAWKSYFALRERWKRGAQEDKPGLPRYRKRKNGSRPADLIPIKCGRSYAVDSRTVALTLPADLRKGSGRIHLPYRGLRRYDGKPGRAEIAFDAGRGRWYFRYAVEFPVTKVAAGERTAGIDLGVRVLASVSIEGCETALHFLGREVLKDWDYWGRKIAAHMRELSHRPAGSRSSKRLRRLCRKRQARWEHAWEALAARIVSVLKASRVGRVVLGWPKDIRREADYTRKWNGRIHGFWSFDRASRIIEKHCARVGVRVERVLEHGTSATCPSCGSKEVTRRPWSMLRCRACGLVMEANQAASRNIAKKNKPNLWDGAEAAPRTEALRWTNHRWADSSNPLQTERLAA